VCGWSGDADFNGAKGLTLNNLFNFSLF
jgi:hypothetical protein